MDIRTRVEKNPFAYILTTVIAASMVVTGITEYFCRERIELTRQKSEIEIRDLQSQLSSIERGLGNSKYLDIRTIVHPKDRSDIGPINLKSKYVSGSGFYAILDLPGWNYSRTTAEEFAENTFSKKLPLALRKAMGDLPIYEWKFGEGQRVEGPGGYANWGPLITVQKTPLDEIKSRVMSNLPGLAEVFTGEKVQAPTPDVLADVRQDLDRVYRGDVAGLQLTYEIEAHFSDVIDSPDINTQLLELQKVGNVVYLQFLTSLQNPSVNSVRVSTFFVREEVLIITDHDAATVITITVPSSDPSPRGPVYAQVQEWLSGLSIPVS